MPFDDPMAQGMTHETVLPGTLYALVDASGSWNWATPGTYGLVDASGSWNWSSSPTYKFGYNTENWEHV